MTEDLPWDREQREVMGWGARRGRCAQTGTSRREALVPANTGCRAGLKARRPTTRQRGREPGPNRRTVTQAGAGAPLGPECANGCRWEGGGPEGEGKWRGV